MFNLHILSWPDLVPNNLSFQDSCLLCVIRKGNYFCYETDFSAPKVRESGQCAVCVRKGLRMTVGQRWMANLSSKDRQQYHFLNQSTSDTVK